MMSARGLPLLFGMDEIERLHAVAHTAALQTGAKGLELDETTSAIFLAMAMQANRATVRAAPTPALRLIEQ